MVKRSAYVIEIGEETAGIVTAEQRGFRFFAAASPYAKLEGAIFNSPRQAEIAARAHRQRQLGLRAANAPAPAAARV